MTVFKKTLLKIVRFLDWCTPKKKNMVTFFSRPDFSDNCRALYEKLIEKTGDKYDMTWVVQDVERFKRRHPDIKVVSHRSLRSIWALCRSRYIVRTHSFWGGIYIPGRQTMCYAYHGMGIKGFELNVKYVHNGFENFSVTSAFFAEKYSENMNTDLDRFVITGLPRNDYLFCQPADLLKKMDLDSYSKRIIWMPTFRANSANGNVEGCSSKSGLPVITDPGLDKLNELLSRKNYVLVIKMHQWAAESVKGIWSHIRLMKDSDIPEPYTLYHFLGLMDVLLTDLSSVSTDFMLLDRPIGYVIDDLDNFRKSRKFFVDPVEDYFAGPYIDTEDKLFLFLNDLDNDVSKEKRTRISKLFLKDADPHSCERYLKAVGLL